MKRLYILFIVVAVGLLSCKKTAEKQPEETPDTYQPPPAVSGKWRKMTFYKMDDIHSFEIIALSQGTKAYLLAYNNVLVYDGSTNRVTQKSNFPGESRNYLMTGTLSGNKIYYGLGYYFEAGTPIKHFNDFWELNLTSEQWTRKADLPVQSFSNAVSVAVDGKVYVMSGRTAQGTVDPSVYEFNPAANVWQNKSTFTYTPSELALSFNGKAYVSKINYITFGGTDFGDLWEYAVSSNKWTQVPNKTLYTPSFSFQSEQKGYIYDKIFTNENYFYEFNPIDYSLKKIELEVGEDFGSGFFMNNKPYLISVKNLDDGARLEIWEYTF